MSEPVHCTSLTEEEGAWCQDFEDPEIQVDDNGPFVLLMLGSRLYEMWPDEAEHLSKRLNEAIAIVKDRTSDR